MQACKKRGNKHTRALRVTVEHLSERKPRSLCCICGVVFVDCKVSNRYSRHEVQSSGDARLLFRLGIHVHIRDPNIVLKRAVQKEAALLPYLKSNFVKRLRYS